MEYTGLNTQEVIELVKYIQENNSWEHMYDILVKQKRPRKIIKYYQMQFDSRTGEMWQISFSDVTGDPTISIKDTIYFRTERGYDLKKRIYDWLDQPRKE